MQLINAELCPEHLWKEQLLNVKWKTYKINKTRDFLILISIDLF